MRSIDRATTFKRDYKREAKGQHRITLDNDLKPVLPVLIALVTDQLLDARYRDPLGHGGDPRIRPCGPSMRATLGRAIGCAEGRNPECVIREVAGTQFGASAFRAGCRFFVTFDDIQIRN